MPGPQNGIIGGDSPTELPESQVDETQLEELRKSAKFSKTTEFKQLKEYMEGRMAFYQKYLPDGRAVGSIPEGFTEMSQAWVVANIVIGELNAVLASYEQAAETVKEYAAAKRPGTS